MTNQEFIESIRLEGEEWRDVIGYEGRYLVSSFGRIISLPAPYKQGTSLCKHSIRLKKVTLSNRGYYYTRLSDGEKRIKNWFIHQLVARAFIPNPNGYKQINHKDENPKNNHASNLEWCNSIYNLNYGTRKEKMIESLRKCAPNKRPVVQLSHDGVYIATFPSVANAARIMGVCDSTICRCCSGLTKPKGQYRWMYLSDYESLVQYVKELYNNPK